MTRQLLIAEQTAELGGSQLGLLDLLPAIVREFSPLVVAPSVGPLTERLDQLGISWTLWPLGDYGSGGKSAADVWRFSRKLPACSALLTELIRQTGARLLLANGPRAFPATAIAARRCKIPSVWNLHLELTSTRDRRVCQTAAALARPRIIACSGACLKVFPARSIARRCGEVLYPGVAEPVIVSRNPQAVGIIGRIHPDKGQDLLLEAARLTPLGRLRFFGIGSGQTAFRKKLEKQAAGLPAGNVDFRGWTDDVGAALAGLHVLVVPSRREALARVIMEAFAAGVPVVAAASGGIPEIVRHEQNGLLIPTGDAKALATAVRRLLDDAELRTRLVDQARRDYLARFTLDRYRNQMLAVLREA